MGNPTLWAAAVKSAIISGETAQCRHDSKVSVIKFPFYPLRRNLLLQQAMFSFTSHLKIYLTLEPQDLRKSFDGLGAIVENDLSLKLTDGGLHIFINKSRTRLKLLYFDGTGLWCSTKRLEQGVFSWPMPSEAGQHYLDLAPEALQLILDGVDLRNGTLRPWYGRK